MLECVSQQCPNNVSSPSLRLPNIREYGNGSIENIDGFTIRSGRDCTDSMDNGDQAEIGKRSERGEIIQHA